MEQPLEPADGTHACMHAWVDSIVDAVPHFSIKSEREGSIGFCLPVQALFFPSKGNKMVLKHEQESKLLDASKKYDAALKEQDLNKLDSLVDTDYVIHADGITLFASHCCHCP